jgi:N-acetylneuraminic acid mutarotase
MIRSVSEAYDPIANTWRTSVPLPSPRSAPGVCAINNTIYVIGGDDASGVLAIVHVLTL